MAELRSKKKKDELRKRVDRLPTFTEKTEEELRKELLASTIDEETEESPYYEDKVEVHKKRTEGLWDVILEDEIHYFDPELSYEITGYRPIDETHGLDFNPDWFTETREVYKRTGQYCPYLRDSKRYNEFWKEQYRRCKYGMTVNGYTITGDNYFFLNFY